MGKYLLADILGHWGANQSPHITKKFTRPGGPVIIIPLTAVWIVVTGGGAFTVVEGTEEEVVQVAEDKAEAKEVDAQTLTTCQAS